MLVVKDATVLIHLAKISLLGKSCEYFRNVFIPELAHQEVQRGLLAGHADATLISEAVKEKRIRVKKAMNDLVDSGYKSSYSIEDLEKELQLLK